MTKEQHLELLTQFETAYDPVKARATGLSPDTMSFVPKEPADAWSIGDHLVHLLDADMMLWHRARVSVAEPGTTVLLWDQEGWHSRLAYDAMDPMAALELASAVRRMLSAGFRALAARDWSEFYMMHPERGRMGLEDVLTLYKNHAGTHLAYIERNMKAYSAR